MKKVIILLALVAALFMTPSYSYASGGGGEAKEGEVKPDFEYYQVPAMVLPVITERGVTQQISLAVSIEVPYGSKDKLALYGPRLVDAYIRDLFGALGSGIVFMKGNVLNVEEIKARLTAVTEKVLGAEKEKLEMRGLLLQAVQQHQI